MPVKTPRSRQGTRGLPAPDYLLWEITLRCNFKCLHCAGGAGRSRQGELTTEEALSLCDSIAGMGIPSVALMGGEPLLRKDWPEIARRLRSLGVEVGLITNGFLFDRAAGDRVLDLGLCQVGVSLDAAAAEVHDRIRGVPGAHARAVRAIAVVNELGIAYPTVITSINKHNFNELDGILDFLLENTESFLWIVNYSSPHRVRPGREPWIIDEKQFEALARFIHEKRPACAGRLNITGTHGLGYYSRRYRELYDFEWTGCLAGTKALGIRSNGDVVGCLILPDPFVEGNVRQRALADMWNDPGAFAATRRFDRRKLKGKCRACDRSAECRAGCTNIACTFTGSMYEAPYCLHHMERDGRGKRHG
jgi:radical SAM protein with 4Fe4S-binding SPASM domain